MKIETAPRDVQSSGMLNQRNFTIKAGAHIMQVLSGLYKNPIDAMVREYATNMYDAYVALRRQNPNATIIPPVLKLPTMLDSNLKFTDYGIGMSADTVWEVYTQYGNSTKNGNNDEVGGFGLGSKTAFCYNGGASWTIESRFNGEKHMFMAFVGEDSVPNLTHVSTMPTDEPNGVTVCIPIRREDVNAVYAAALRYVPYFPMEITVEGDNASAMPKPVSYMFRDANWGLRDSNRNGSHGITVIMGNVPYRVEVNQYDPSRQFDKKNDYDYQYNVRNFFYHNSIDLFVPIGACDIVPSRDDLKYTDKTKAAIHAGLKELLENLNKIAAKQVASCKTEWEATQSLAAIQGISGISNFVKTCKWNGKTISVEGVTRSIAALQALDPSMTITVIGNETGNQSTMTVLTPTDVLMRGVGRSLRDGTKLGASYVVINDLPKGGALITKSLLYDKNVYRSPQGRAYGYGHSVGLAILLDNTSLTADQLSEFFGGFPPTFITTTSHLKGVVPIPPQLRARKDTIYRWNNRSSFEARVKMPDAAAGPYFFVVVDKNPSTGRFTYKGKGYRTSKEEVNQLFDHATSLEIAGFSYATPLYGVKEADVANLDTSVWQNLDQLISDAIAAKVSDKQLIENLAYMRVSFNHRSNYMLKVIKAVGLEKFNDDFVRLMEVHDKNATALKDSSASMFNSRLQDEANTPTPPRPTWAKLVEKKIQAIKISNPNDLCEALLQKYPMLAVMVDVIENSGYYHGYGRQDPFVKNRQQILAYMKSIV